MATADPLIDPAITEADLSPVDASPAPNHTEDAAAAAAAAAAVDALAASQFDGASALGVGGSGPDDAAQNGGNLTRGQPQHIPQAQHVQHAQHAQHMQHIQHAQHIQHTQQHTQHAQPPPPSSIIRAQPAPAPTPPPPAPISSAYVQHYNPAAHAHLTLYLAALHGARITADNLSGTFAPPLHHEKLLDWWKVRLTTAAVFLLIRPPQETVHGSSSGYGANYQAQPSLAQALSSPSPPPPPPTLTTTTTTTTPTSTKISGQDLVGVIMLQSHPSETSPHVATVELLLVNLQYRQLGGERQLLETVEQQAVLEGRTLLTAETESDSSMATMYKDLGFTEAGRIPGMINRPLTGEKRSQSIFYKDLSSRL